MPPSNPKDKGKARASAEDLSDNENASASRSGPAVHPYASIPQASTSPSRQLNVPASSSRRSSSPSPLYSPPLATRRASSASSSRSRPYTARVATDTEDEQYEYNSSASWSEARFFDQGTRQDASGSRQSVSPLESFREPVSALRLLTYVILSCHSRRRAIRPCINLSPWILSSAPCWMQNASPSTDHPHQPNRLNHTTKPNSLR